MDGLPTKKLEQLVQRWSGREIASVSGPSAPPLVEVGGELNREHDGGKLNPPLPQGEGEGGGWMFVRQLTCNNKGDLLITVAVGPKRRPVTFLLDTRAQITALSRIEAKRCGISVPSKSLIVLNALGKTQTVPMTPVTLWLPREEDPVDTMVAVGPFQMNLLGMDILKGKQWCDTQGNSWSFSAPQITQLAKIPSAEVRLLQAAPALPPAKFTNVKPYPLPLGARAGAAPVLAELREQGVVVPTHSPYSSPVWPVRKPNGKRRLTVDYRRLNANTGPLTAAVPNIAELISTTQEPAHPILATNPIPPHFFSSPTGVFPTSLLFFSVASSPRPRPNRRLPSPSDLRFPVHQNKVYKVAWHMTAFASSSRLLGWHRNLPDVRSGQCVG